ncbi:hypothetical protein [uncultured Oscillibacter sp.]|uniref:hypothetical protein n=1 Tax=uncultured Oscillibacter sp. TaxID=876091 RepID=UPI00262D97C0|nr:hypothetical protein [uncultured Oscillibacter sp.]
MSSFDRYDEGSATAEYRRSVDKAARIAEEQKRKAPPDHHLEIDCLLDAYARRLAANINRGNAIAARLPSVLFGHKGLHFPAQKVERQRRDAAANQAERQRIESILDKIRGSAVEVEKDSGDCARAPRISAGDPDLVQKLTSRAKRLEARQKLMLEVNAYYREHKTLEGCSVLTPEEIETLTASMAQSGQTAPYGSSVLVNHHCKIRNVRLRLSELAAQTEGGVMHPVSSPRNGWYFYIIPDLGAKEYTASFRNAKARFLELRSQGYGGKITEPASDGGPSTCLVLGIESEDGLSTADILHVCRGKNCLVTDFTQMDRLLEDLAVSEILCRVSREIGFDLVRRRGHSAVPFEEWDNPWFPAATPGSIAAGVYELAVQCGAVTEDGPSERRKHVGQLTRLIQSGERGAGQARMLAVTYAADAGLPGAVHHRVDSLMKQFDEYQGRTQKVTVRRRKFKIRGGGR